MTSKPIRLLLVDAPALTRKCLAALLNRRRRLQVVGDASNGSEALTLSRSLQPDVAVVNLEVPEGGTELITQLRQQAPDCAVLVLTASRKEGAAARVLQAGASGYLDKECDPDDLTRAIERIHAGDRVVWLIAADTVLGNPQSENSQETLLDGLTERETEVLGLVIQGRTNPQIATELCITDHTVKTHLAKILGKLGLNNRVQATAYATQHGLIPHAATSSPTLGDPV